LSWETIEQKAALLFLFLGGRYSDYISGFIFVLYVHCCPDQSDLSDLQGKEIAATTANSDG